jgi:threonine/homoserine/homoserine lactone efflux protein
MPSGSTLAAFTIASLLYVAVPGPNVIYVTARGISQGRRAAVVSALGLETGNLVHVTAAAVGIAALVASSAVAFSMLKYVGAGYLIYLGIKTLVRRAPAHHHGDVTQPPDAGLWRVYLQGVIVDVFNPKSALFFLAFLPQFIAPGQGSRLTQILVLIIIVTIIGIASDMSYALAAGTVGVWLNQHPRFLHGQRYVTGGIYLALGVTAAVAGGHRHPLPSGPRRAASGLAIM